MGETSALGGPVALLSLGTRCGRPPSCAAESGSGAGPVAPACPHCDVLQRKMQLDLPPSRLNGLHFVRRTPGFPGWC